VARYQGRQVPTNNHDDRISDLDRRVATIEATLEGVAAGVEDLRNREAQPTNWLAFLVAASIIGAGGAVYMDTRLKPTETTVQHLAVVSTANAERVGAMETIVAMTAKHTDKTAAQQAIVRERIAAIEALTRASQPARLP
jgi:uncharacterized coiled-coil protein SlyX